MSASGQLGGTPTTTFNGGIGISVTDTGSHATASTSLSLSITATPLTLSGSGALGNFNQGAPISASFSASGGVPPYTWSVGGGLSVDSNGHVTGAAGSPGNYSATLSVTDTANESASRTLTFSSFGITTSGLPPGTTTSAYSASITAAGGTPPYSFTASGLPPGVTFSGNTFGGTPTVAGSYSVTVHASDSGGLSASAGYSITITGAAPLSVFSSSLSDATVGQPYNGSLSASGGVTPYTWSQSGGVLPAGLSIGSSGTISGTATTPGPYSVGVKVTDAQNNFAVGSVSIDVDPAPLQIANGANFPSGIAGVAYPTQLLMASGGLPPYTFSVTGSLPSGLALSGSQIAGMPTAAGTSSFTLKVTDASSPAVTGVLGVTLNVRPSAPDIVLAASTASFSITAGTTSPPSAVTVGVTSSIIAQNLAFSATASVPWLTVTGGSTTPGVTSIALNAAALALTPAGSPYSGTVSVVCTTSGCGGVPQTVTVTLVVSAPPPLLTLGANILSFASLTSNPASQSASLSILNAGGGMLQINSVSSDSPWLTTSAAPTSVLPGPGSSINVTVNPAGLAAGYYRGTVSFVSTGGNASTVVTLFISGSATMTLGPSGAQFTLPQGGVLGYNSGSFSIDASNGATVPYTATVVGTPWLSITGASGTATPGAPGNVGFTIDPTAAANFAAGAYYGTIQVSGSGVVNSPQVFQVVVNVTPATTPVVPNPSPAGLVFVSAGSGVAPQTINVYASSRTPLSFQAAASTDTGQWLSISPSTGSASAAAPGSVTVTATPAGLAAGAYRGLVSFTFGTAVQAVNVTLIVEPTQTQQPAISSVHGSASGPTCANAQLVPTETGLVSNFSAPAAWPVPLTVQLFDTCGSPVGNGQIVATFSNGDPLLPLTAVGNTSGLYSGTWTPRAPSSAVTITAVVSAAGYPSAQIKIAGQTPPNSAPILAPNGAGDIFNPAVGAGLGPGQHHPDLRLEPCVEHQHARRAAAADPGQRHHGDHRRRPGSAVLREPDADQRADSVRPGRRQPVPVAGERQRRADHASAASAQRRRARDPELHLGRGRRPASRRHARHVRPRPPSPGEYIVIYSSGLGDTDIMVRHGRRLALESARERSQSARATR